MFWSFDAMCIKSVTWTFETLLMRYDNVTFLYYKTLKRILRRIFCQMLGYKKKLNSKIRFFWQLFDGSGFTGLKVYVQLMSKTLDALSQVCQCLMVSPACFHFLCLLPLCCCVLCCVLIGILSCMSCSSPYLTTLPRLGTFTVSLLDWSYFFVFVSWLCYLGTMVSTVLPSFCFHQQW